MIEYAVMITYVGLMVSFGLCSYRLIRGPMLADRVVALDMIAFITIGFIAVYTIDSDEKAYMDIAVTLALVAFLTTVAFSIFIKRGVTKE